MLKLFEAYCDANCIELRYAHCHACVEVLLLDAEAALCACELGVIGVQKM